MMVKINEQDWTIKKRKLKNFWGWCEHPDTANRKIVLDKTMSGIEELEFTIHEVIHASCWFLSERIVSKMAKDIANILWEMGFRK